MSNDVLTTSLGQCWSFPLEFSPYNGVKMAAGIDAVMQSIRILFMTEPGERIMRENWGGGLNNFIFENISDELLASLRNHIEESILRHESRVVLKDLIIQPAQDDTSQLLIQIIVCLSGSNFVERIEGILNINDGQMLRLL